MARPNQLMRTFFRRKSAVHIYGISGWLFTNAIIRSHQYSGSSLKCSDFLERKLYLHIAPCGDWWLGSEIYAAKHLPSGYVRSIRLPDDFDEDDHVLDILPELKIMAMYDTGTLDLSIPLPAPQEDTDGDGKDVQR